MKIPSRMKMTTKYTKLKPRKSHILALNHQIRLTCHPLTPPYHLGEFPIVSYLKVTDSTKSGATFLVLVRGIFFYII